MNIAIIFAGGVGQRMGAEIPKQFLPLFNKEIIIHTLEKFQYHEQIDKIYIACKEEYIDFLYDLIRKYNITKVADGNIVKGGATGQDSIYNALAKVYSENAEDSVVLIHDGVRPNITEQVISDNIKSVMEYGSAITSTKMKETPVIVNENNEVLDLPNRATVRTAQAPQSFYLKDIINVHELERKLENPYEGIVDSCGLMLKYGFNVRLIDGNDGNVKVTTTADLALLLGQGLTNNVVNLLNYMPNETSNEKSKIKVRSKINE